MAVLKGDIVLFNCLIDDIQPIGILLKILNVFRCYIVLGLYVLGNDPFGQGCNYFAHFKIYKAEQIAGRNIQFIELEASAQHIDRAAQIPDLSLLKSLVIVKPREDNRLFLDRHIAAAFRAVCGIVELRTAVHAFHNDSYSFRSVFSPAGSLSQHFLKYIDDICQVTRINSTFRLVDIKTRCKFL